MVKVVRYKIDMVLKFIAKDKEDKYGYIPVEYLDALILIVVALTIGVALLNRLIPIMSEGYTGIENGVRVLKGGGII